MKFISNQNNLFLEQSTKNKLSEDKYFLKILLSPNTNNSEYLYNENFINCCDDKEIIQDIENLYKKIFLNDDENLKYIFLIGIGGSNLGVKAIYDFMFLNRDIFCTSQKKNNKKIFFLDSNDALRMQESIKFLNNVKNKNEVLIIVSSKSGLTSETIANAECFIDASKNIFGSDFNKVVVITKENSKLWSSAIKNNFYVLKHQNVGGRFSIFSSVGLFPLFCLGLDINSFIDGAKMAKQICLQDDVNKNIAIISANIIFENFKNGKILNDMFIFEQSLESLGKWWRQLVGESLGKEFDLKGKKVNTGITPTISIGSTDLHSVGQLYLGGPKDKFTTFISVLNKQDVDIPKKRIFDDLVLELSNKSLNKLLNAILQGTKIAYIKNDLPFCEIIFEELSLKEIGFFMQFKMFEIIYLAKLLNVNAFDQPNVENYKKETKNILAFE